MQQSPITDKPFDLMKTMMNLKEDVASYFLMIMIFFIILLGLIYFYYVSNLLSGECSTMDNMYGTVNGKIHSLSNTDPSCQYNLRDYYIKTAYNCCSGGHYKNDWVSTCSLINVLKQGVRCLDFEIYSVGNEPVVATSTVDNNFIKETYNYVPFSDVMSVVQKYAFSGNLSPNPMDPIIFHLRIKSTNLEMYQNLADVFKQYKELFLGPESSYENRGTNIGTTKLMTLCRKGPGDPGKIVVIVDKINNSFMDNKDFYEYVNLTSNSMFMRALPYFNVKNSPDFTELQEYNKMNMSIAMPDKGPNPEQPNSIVCRENGCQMVAMRYQQFDPLLEADMGYFDKCGYAFCLKPERLRYIPVTIPDPKTQKPELSYASRKVETDYYNFNI